MTSAKPTNVDNIEDLNLGENLKSATIDNNVENLKLGENPKPVETLDPFSPKNLRLSQAYLESTPAKKLLTTVLVRKPGQQDFLRVHHDPSFCESFAMIELRDDREEYIVHASLVPELWDDVLALQRLLLAMSPHIDLPRALLRGRYMAAASAMQYAGIPIDVETLLRTRGSWTDIQDELIKAVDRDYGVFEGRTFKRERWASWCVNQNIPWPQLATGQIDLSDETIPTDGKSLSACCTDARVTLQLIRTSLERSCGRQRWAQSDSVVGVSVSYRAQSTFQL